MIHDKTICHKLKTFSVAKWLVVICNHILIHDGTIMPFVGIFITIFDIDFVN